jgi:hypothetical protein
VYLLVVRCGVRWCFGVWVLFTNTGYVRGWVCFVGWFSYSGNKKRPESDESTPEPGSKKSKAPVSDSTLTGLFLKMTLYYRFLSWWCQVQAGKLESR